jgi:hypothetical protein
MHRLLATATFAAALFTAPATAQPVSHYSATFATAPAKGAIVTRNTIWKCNGTTCNAPKSGTRDAIMCELVAREVGTLQSFAVAGAAFDADALAKCNTRAKG